MNVYVARIGWDHEGDYVVGIFSTKEKAIDFLQQKDCVMHGDWCRVTEHGVDSVVGRYSWQPDGEVVYRKDNVR